MNHQGDDGRRHQTFYPQFALDEQIDGHQRRNDRAADIDRDHSAVPIAHHGHGVAHAVEIDDLIGHHMLGRQFRDRDVEEAAD